MSLLGVLLGVDAISYALKDYAFTINNNRITAISKIEVDPNNPKRPHLSLKNHRISKGVLLTYILDDNYQETNQPYQGFLAN